MNLFCAFLLGGVGFAFAFNVIDIKLANGRQILSCFLECSPSRLSRLMGLLPFLLSAPKKSLIKNITRERNKRQFILYYGLCNKRCCFVNNIRITLLKIPLFPSQ